MGIVASRSAVISQGALHRPRRCDHSRSSGHYARCVSSESPSKGSWSYAEEQTVEIDQHLTLLAGRNNVGKSALLRALQIPVERQEGVGTDFGITYTWSVTVEDITQHAAGSAEMVAELTPNLSPLRQAQQRDSPEHDVDYGYER